MSNHLGDTNKMVKSETYMTIHADGRITVSDKLKPDETAARVLECMKTQFIGDAQATKIRELQDRIMRLQAELEQTKQDRNAIAKNTREPLLLQLDHANERIKRLEEGGDNAVFILHYPDRLAVWNKAKEAKL